MANSDIDAVYIASPNSLHVAHSKIFLNAGKTIHEKPVASHSRDVICLQELVKNKGDFPRGQYVHVSAYERVFEEARKIGNITMAKLIFFAKDPQSF